MIKKSKNKYKQLTKKLDTIWANTIKTRAGYICERCGRGNMMMNAAHIVRRGNKGVRWRLDNGLCLCVGCHYWLDNSSNRLDTHEWLAAYLGEAKLNELKFAARHPHQWLLYDLEQMQLSLQKSE